MFQKLVSHNDDIRRLVERGYAVAFDDGFMIVRDIPYLDSNRALQWGAFVTKLKDIDGSRVEQVDHQVFFAGGVPHELDGKQIANLAGGPTPLALGAGCEDVVVQRSFSNKPRDTGKFADFFEKIESYVRIISGPAMELHQANPLTFRAVKSITMDSVFKYQDTLTSRAEIGDLSARFKQDVVAVIGVGGTGAYILDFLVKTPVREIRAFEPDVYHVHNAFRSPGRLEQSELGKSKAEVFAGRYESFRTGLSVTKKFIDASCGSDFDGVTFAFVCVDKGSSRAGIFDLLISKGIPFIDVGMGLKRKDEGPLRGMLRATYYSAADAQRVREQGLAELTDRPADLYHANIQTGELNALNACLAVIKYKQLRGFYLDERSYYHLLFGVGDTKIVGESDNHENSARASPVHAEGAQARCAVRVGGVQDVGTPVRLWMWRKVRTPLGPTEWQFKDTKGGPTLVPSIGNWQFPCQSHYWIRGGKVVWAEKWTPEQIAAGRHEEAARRHAHYDALDRQRGNKLARFWRWLMRLLGW